VPDPDSRDVWEPGVVLGPMARTVGDLALLLAALSGPDARCSLSHGDPAAFGTEPRGEPSGRPIAWCPRLGGLPIESPVLDVLQAGRARLEACGADIRDVELDLSRADAAFEVTRALSFARAFGADLPRLRGVAKAAVIWNIERGLALDAATIADATAAPVAGLRRGRTGAWALRRGRRAGRAGQPFPVEWEYPKSVTGVEMPHYLGWMRVCSRITVSAHPVAAIPIGLTDEGLPVGAPARRSPPGRPSSPGPSRCVRRGYRICPETSGASVMSRPGPAR
jgi:amidase